jgi:hypothetical protein
MAIILAHCSAFSFSHLPIGCAFQTATVTPLALQFGVVEYLGGIFHLMPLKWGRMADLCGVRSGCLPLGIPRQEDSSGGSDDGEDGG